MDLISSLIFGNPTSLKAVVCFKKLTPKVFLKKAGWSRQFLRLHLPPLDEEPCMKIQEIYQIFKQKCLDIFLFTK